MEEKKFCEYCGNEVYKDAVMCPKCGRQIQELVILKLLLIIVIQ